MEEFISFLWFDDDVRRTMEDIVKRASARYVQKYGKKPTMCFVNPLDAPKGEFVIDGVKVLPAKEVPVQRRNYRLTNGENGREI